MRFLLFLLLCSCATRKGRAQETPQTENGIVTESGMKLSSLKPMFGTASYYAEKFNGRQTADGGTYYSNKLSAACNRVPLGTWLRVTNLSNKRVIIVRVNDRLAAHNKRVVDLSRLGAEKLGYIGSGLTQVKVEVLVHKGG